MWSGHNSVFFSPLLNRLAEEKFGQQALHIVEDRPANKPQKFGKHAKSDSDANRKQRRADSRQRGATKG